jgi:DNA primase
VTRYTADSRDRVRDAVDMLALVSARTELRRAGVDSYFGLCPFHDERTPSFHVRPDERHYHCFGCQMSGDPFDFVMETEGLDFRGALEALAERFGVRLETEDEDPAAASRRERRERLHALLSRAAVFYSRYLWEAREAAPAREYLLGRGFTEQTLREFRVGYAPSAWDRLLLASRGSGFSDEELLATGLAQRSRERPGQIYDRFRRRIVFPAVDARGKVRGFGARAMGEGQQPKYLNTSDGELYHKREQLFGIDLARVAASRAGRMILVEGYTDVLALHQAGIRNAVGIMGTSLTEEQVSALERVVGVLELCLDADSAGQEAMLRAARVAAGRGLELRVVPLPDGTDPGELIAVEGAEALRERVRSSLPFVVFRVERILSGEDLRSAEGKDRALAELGPLLAEVGEGMLRDELLRRIAGRLELPEHRLAMLAAASPPAPRPGARGAAAGRSPAASLAVPAADSSAPSAAVPAAGLDQQRRLERAFLALCLAVPDAGEQTLGAVELDELLTSGIYRRVARHLRGRLTAPLSELPPGDEELAQTVAELVQRAARGVAVGPEHLEHARLLLELARLERRIRRARVEAGLDPLALAREREVVRGELHAVASKIERPV